MNRALIIGITGGSGSGKTSFIRELKKCFTDEQVCYISQDDYYRPREEQKADERGVCNFDLPKSIDKKAFARDLRRLIAGEAVTRREYVFNNQQTTPRQLVFRPAPVLIVEGIFVLHFKKIRELLDLKIFLHAKENLKVIRRIKRDREERNYPLEDVLYRYENHVLPTFERYIKPYMEEADVIINNNDHFNLGLQVITGFVNNYLMQQTTPNGKTPPSNWNAAEAGKEQGDALEENGREA